MKSSDRPKFGNLQNLKVLNAGAVIAAPFVCELFAEQGADVIELESTVAPDMYRCLLYTSFEDGLERDPDYYRYTGNNKPFTGETYYALVTNSVILATVGGLTINGDTQVLDKDGKVIEGLYATGNVSGNFYAGNYPRQDVYKRQTAWRTASRDSACATSLRWKLQRVASWEPRRLRVGVATSMATCRRSSLSRCSKRAVLSFLWARGFCNMLWTPVNDGGRRSPRLP